jgi:hypothetical protein
LKSATGSVAASEAVEKQIRAGKRILKIVRMSLPVQTVSQGEVGFHHGARE